MQKKRLQNFEYTESFPARLEVGVKIYQLKFCCSYTPNGQPHWDSLVTPFRGFWILRHSPLKWKIFSKRRAGASSQAFVALLQCSHGNFALVTVTVPHCCTSAKRRTLEFITGVIGVAFNIRCGYISLRKHPFLLALRRLERFARRKSQAILKCFTYTDLKSSVWFTLGSENPCFVTLKTFFSWTAGQGLQNTKWPAVLYSQ